MYEVKYWGGSNYNRWMSFTEYGPDFKDTAYQIAHQLSLLFGGVEIHIKNPDGTLEIETISYKAKMRVENKSGYGFHQSNMGPELEGNPNLRKRKTMQVEFITDMVPGAFHEQEDLVNWVLSNPYVTAVTHYKEKE